jgi:hypothetical protein
MLLRDTQQSANYSGAGRINDDSDEATPSSAANRTVPAERSPRWLHEIVASFFKARIAISNPLRKTRHGAH